MTFMLSSPAVSDGGEIPSQYTCDGADEVLPVAWSDPPPGTVELALVMDDPDARGFVHWVVAGIAAPASSLGGSLPAGAVAGRNDFDNVGYGGPCPPSGTHRYRLTLYALSAPLSVAGTLTAAAVRAAAASKTLATATLTARYTRRR